MFIKSNLKAQLKYSQVNNEHRRMAHRITPGIQSNVQLKTLTRQERDINQTGLAISSFDKRLPRKEIFGALRIILKSYSAFGQSTAQVHGKPVNKS